MQSSVWDKSLISLIISPLVGILVMNGYISPDHADAVTQQADLWVGATIFLGGLLIGVLHHHTIQENQHEYEYTTEETQENGTTTTGQLPISGATVPETIEPQSPGQPTN